jgi:hypothetical protein
MDTLHRMALDHLDAGAQHLMPPHDLIHAGFQRLHV